MKDSSTRKASIFTQHSMARLLVPVGKPVVVVCTKSSTPSKLKPFPTSPVAKATPLDKPPLFPSTESKAFNSARHQLTTPEGTGVQGGGGGHLPALLAA